MRGSGQLASKTQVVSFALAVLMQALCFSFKLVADCICRVCACSCVSVHLYVKIVYFHVYTVFEMMSCVLCCCVWLPRVAHIWCQQRRREPWSCIIETGWMHTHTRARTHPHMRTHTHTHVDIHAQTHTHALCAPVQEPRAPPLCVF